MSEAAKETSEKDQLAHLVKVASDMRNKKDAIAKESNAKMRKRVDLLNNTFMEKGKDWKLSAEGQAFSKIVHASFDRAAERRQQAAIGSLWLSQKIHQFEEDARQKNDQATAPSSSGGSQGTDEDWSEILRKAMEADDFFDRCTKGGPGERKKRGSENDEPVDSDSLNKTRDEGLLKSRWI